MTRANSFSQMLFYVFLLTFAASSFGAQALDESIGSIKAMLQETRMY